MLYVRPTLELVRFSPSVGYSPMTLPVVRRQAFPPFGVLFDVDASPATDFEVPK
jgi:hypothetical protein